MKSVPESKSVMGDVKETVFQITPETPGGLPVLNPFESPSDYHSLQETVFASPNIFTSSKTASTSSSTPGKFRWSIDQIAIINPVEIDPEDIRRQALYMSCTGVDTEIEDRRQKAIEDFFTKSVIVPSPWTQHEGKPVSQFHSTKRIDVNSVSPADREIHVQPGKNHAACQTLLSLPVDFNLEKILGEYFRSGEPADQSQESMSSFSLRRKLFLDGNGSGSESSSPPSPQESPCDGPAASPGVLSSIDLSPVRCRSPIETPSSAQFSSSPIQGGTRAYSFGSVTSPPFPETSSQSPALSPIAPQMMGRASISEKKKPTFISPDGPPAAISNEVSQCARSPCIEGCSPIKTCFPVEPRTCKAGLSYLISPGCFSFTLDEHADENKENSPPPDPLAPQEDTEMGSPHSEEAAVLSMDLVVAVKETNRHAVVFEEAPSLLKTCELKDNTVDMVDMVEIVEGATLVKEAVGNGSIEMTSSMNGITFNVESSHVSLSPLAESSAIPCDGNSLQVDSGYNTQTYVSSMMDTIGAEISGKENLDTQSHAKEFSASEIKDSCLLSRMQSPEISINSYGFLRLDTPFSLGALKQTHEPPFNKFKKNGTYMRFCLYHRCGWEMGRQTDGLKILLLQALPAGPKEQLRSAFTVSGVLAESSS
nr:PREDICTED: protein aurora borealis isoform X2 [Latimeria chalumnae]|eukprot:XP_006006527.1 PREDICTED: protein aurora borealis isoform X2 [Latimeria chalumnae]